MSSKIDREIYITIDLNDDLIRIPRVTINELGCPEFIQLLIHPEKRTLAIRTCSQGGVHTHRIKSALLNSEESFELHSRFLMKSLNQICGNLTEGKSFRIKGRMYEHKTLAVFLLEDDRYGFHILDRTLRLAIGTWEGDPGSFSGNMLKGISHIAFSYSESLKDEVFKERCSRESVKEISRDAKARRSGSIGYSEKLILLYNKGSRGGLPINKLYDKTKKAAQEYNAKKKEYDY